MRLILLHSPLIGASAWLAVAAEAVERGFDIQLPAIPDLSLIPQPYYPVIGKGVARQIEGKGPAALVVHSSAGGLVPSIVAASEGVIEQVVYADAILPHPGRSWFETTGDDFATALRATVVDGLVPRWEEWFPAGAIAGMIDDDTARAVFQDELKPTPVAYLEEVAPDLDLPDDVAWSYLRLSRAYENEAAHARSLGRPTLREDLHHLAMFTHPEEVMSAIANLVRG
ncbi:hypothetical protein [Phenylobacterium aquaticum]|uniref:hypothetical protein n=1 Tax=Phenylobacterium aquaticum TaxID=1763816 RepID=UPI0026F1DB23|nr:hypothetical protein [Phenylobacterium aquaticum]